MAEELYEQHASLSDKQAKLAEKAVICAVRAAFGDLSQEYKRHLRSLVSPRRPSASQQQLTRARKKMEAARDSAAHLIAIALNYGFGILVDFPPIETADSNGNVNVQVPEAVMNEASNEQDHAGPPIASNPVTLTRRSVRTSASKKVNYSVAMENSVIEQQLRILTLLEITQSGETATVRDEIVPSFENDTMQVKEEHLEDDGPGLIDNSANQDSVLDGSLDEELENISQQKGRGNTYDTQMIDSTEDDNEYAPEQEVLNEQGNSTESSNEQDQAGPSMVFNPVSTVTTAAGTVNYAGAMDNSVSDQQQGTLTATSKRKRSNDRRSRKSAAHMRTRVVPAPTVAPQEAGESEDEDDPEPDAVSLSILVRRLKCRVPGCPKVFPGKVQLDVHHVTKHAIEKYACKVKDCTESYATKTELKAHRNSAHDNLDNDWPCGQCELTCNTYSDLYRHTYFYHEYGLFACSADKCDFTEKTRIKVKNHQLKHRPAKHRCTYAGCSSSFNLKPRLTTHLRTHSKEKPYSCTWPHCDFSASDQSTVIKHIRGVHFHLPLTKKEQAKRGIIDDRDARLFLKKTATGN